MNEEIFGILNDADEVIESVGYDPLGMNTVLEKGINISVDNIANNLDPANLKDPLVVSKLKREIQSAKKWDKLLKVIQKLNAIVAGGVFVGGSAKVASGMKVFNDASNAYNQAASSYLTTGDYNAVVNTSNAQFNAAADVANTKASMKTILLIHAAIAVMTPLLKKAIRNREVTNLSMVKNQVDSSIALYEKQMKNLKSDDEKKKLQEAIDRLKDLKAVMDSESERIVDEDKRKIDKK